jgi:hypothetical protein
VRPRKGANSSSREGRTRLASSCRLANGRLFDKTVGVADFISRALAYDNLKRAEKDLNLAGEVLADNSDATRTEFLSKKYAQALEDVATEHEHLAKQYRGEASAIRAELEP